MAQTDTPMDENYRLPLTGIILAGGRNSRMKAPKAFLEVGGRRIIDRQIDTLSGLFDEVLVVADRGEDYEGLGVRVVTDADAFRHIKCPLTGVFSGLAQAANDRCFVVGCDMPFIEPGLVGWLVSLGGRAELVIPVRDGYPEPLFGVYPRGAADIMEASLLDGETKLGVVFERMDVQYVSGDRLREYDPDLVSFMNVNTPEDLEVARAMAGRVLVRDECLEAPRGLR